MTRIRAGAALLRASFRTAASYRLRFGISLVSILVTVVPVFFVANALQPVMGESIANEGGSYFAFLLLGFVALSLIQAATESLPSQVSSDISSGFFEALSGAPVGAATVLVGLTMYPVAFTLVRGSAMVALGAWLGVDLAWGRVPAASVIVLLLLAAHFGVALIATAGVIAFRTTVALPQVMTSASALLGGVYWPTSVIPSWVQRVSDAFPISYGLRAIRRVVLDGQGLASVRDDVMTLAGFAGFLLAIGVLAISAALAHARRRGSLSHY